MSVVKKNISRFDIINWINNTLLLNLQRIEQLGSGNVYCQLLDAAYPSRIALHRVKWDAKVQTQFLHNLKILQNALKYLGIQKEIEIQKLSKAKYQDNYDFIQWLKIFLESKIDYSNYQPLQRRNYAQIFYISFQERKRQKKENINKSIDMRMSVKVGVQAKIEKSLFLRRNSLAYFDKQDKHNVNTKILGVKNIENVENIENFNDEKQINLKNMSKKVFQSVINYF